MKCDIVQQIVFVANCIKDTLASPWRQHKLLDQKMFGESKIKEAAATATSSAAESFGSTD